MELPANTSPTGSTELENLGKEQVLGEEAIVGCPESETPNAIPRGSAAAIPNAIPRGPAAAVPATVSNSYAAIQRSSQTAAVPAAVSNGYTAIPRGSQTATLPTTVAKGAKGPATANPATIANG